MPRVIVNDHRRQAGSYNEPRLPLLYTTQAGCQAAVLLLLILILGAPSNTLSDYGHTELRRGAECWGKSLLLGLSRDNGTHISRYLNNGYVPHPKKLPPAFARNPTFSSTLNQLNLR